MKSSDLYEPNLSFGVLLQGPPKTGKTQLLLSMPSPYIADCDNNLGGAVRFFRQHHPTKKFFYDTINVADDSPFCKDLGLSLDQSVPPEHRWNRLVICCKEAAKNPDIKTICVDSLSFVTDYLCDYIVSKKPASEERQMTIKDWVPYKNMLTKFVTTFRSVNKLFAMSCHEITEKDDGTGVIIYKPHMQSKLQDNFGGFFSDVWLTCCENIGGSFQYFVKTMPQTRRALGNSLGLPENFKFIMEDFQTHLNRNAKFDQKTPSA
jgi:hypothetical protein